MSSHIILAILLRHFISLYSIKVHCVLNTLSKNSFSIIVMDMKIHNHNCWYWHIVMTTTTMRMAVVMAMVVSETVISIISIDCENDHYTDEDKLVSLMTIKIIMTTLCAVNIAFSLSLWSLSLSGLVFLSTLLLSSLISAPPPSLPPPLTLHSRSFYRYHYHPFSFSSPS